MFKSIVVASVTLIMAVAWPIDGAYSKDESRTLNLFNPRNNEKVEVLYKVGDTFLDKGLKRIDYFLRDWRSNEQIRIDPRVVDLLWEIYQETGSKNAIHVVSGYRSAKTNMALKKAGRQVARNSQHTHGKAIDFYIPNVPIKKLRDIALRKQYGGVGYYPNENSAFVHIDVGTVRHWPRMNDRTLRAVFPYGKTLHVPSSGKTLPSYQAMMRTYGREGLKPSKRSLVIAKGHKEQNLRASLEANSIVAPVITTYASAPKSITSAFDRIIKPGRLPISRKALRVPEIEFAALAPPKPRKEIRKIATPEPKTHSKARNNALFASLSSRQDESQPIKTKIIETVRIDTQGKTRLKRSNADFIRGFAIAQHGRMTADRITLSIDLTKKYLSTLDDLRPV